MNAHSHPGQVLPAWWRRHTGVLTVLLAVLLSSSLVYRASTAAFSDTTENGTNHWEAGSIALSDDDSSTAMFNVTGITPASTGSRCIVVTYTGTGPAAVSLWGSASGALAPYLNLTVQTGTGGTFAAGDPCTGFTPSATIYTGTLANFAATADDYDSGVPAAASRWRPTTNASLIYRFSYTVTDEANAEGASADADFPGEARGA